LGSSQPWIVVLGAPGGEQQGAVGGELGDGDAGVVAPPHRFQRQAAGVAEDDDAPNGALYPGQAAGAAVRAETVREDEVPTGDRDAEPVSVEDEYPCSGGVAAEDILCGRTRRRHFGYLPARNVS